MTPHSDADIEQMDLLELEKLCIQLATLYDQGEACIDFDGDSVTDAQYDSLLRILKKRKPDSIAFAPGTTSPSTYDPASDGITKIVIHHPPMTSIDKADGTLDQKKARLKKWVDDCHNRLVKSNKMVKSIKHDGVALRVYYEKGNLARAGLRPRNGVKGIDVTENVKYVKGIPTKLPLPLTLAIGGELECRLADFEAVNKALQAAGEKLRENPRNHTAGAMAQKDPLKTKEAKISFTGYNITGFDKSADYYKTELERAKWCNQVLKVPFVRVSPLSDDLDEAVDELLKMEKLVPELEYEVDGVILKVDNLEDQEQLGHSNDDPVKEPRGALAWKFAEESQVAEVNYIDWNASRTGRVVPRAFFTTGIRLAGTTVKKATCNNVGWIQRMGIGKGTKVTVIKAGKIIPKVIDVVSGKTTTEQPPANCPTCNSKLNVVKGSPPNVDLVCVNTDCAAKHVSRFVYYLQGIEAKGLAESSMEDILQTGKVKEIADLYNLTEKDLIDVDFSEREAILAIATIQMVKPVKDNDKLRATLAKKKKPLIPAWQVFAGLGIKGAGKTAGKALIDHYGDFHKIMEATEDELLGVAGIGTITSKDIYQYFLKNKDAVKRLIDHVELELPKTGKLSGQSFVLSGSFDDGKSFWEKKIQDLGGKTSDSVSKNTTYLVAGPGSGSKSDKATQLGIKIIDVEELKKIL